MKIAINCRSFSKPYNTGIGRYAYNLVKNLKEIDRENRYCLYLQKGIFSSRRIPKINASNFSVKNDYFNLGAEKLFKGIDIYHSPSPDALPDCRAKVVVTVHDLIFKVYPKGHSPQTLAVAEKQFKEILDKAQIIICISRTTQEDMRRYFGVEEKRLRLIYQGVDRDVFCRLNEGELIEARERIRTGGINTPFLLSVGTIEPRKNLEGTIRAFGVLKAKRRFKGKLVVVGMKGWGDNSLFDLIDHLALKDDIVFLGYIPDAELVDFYNCAEVFVYPSFYEGFGFPILEAFSCGVPVVTSDVSSCGELAWEAALTVDPHNPDAIAAAIEKVLEDKEFKGKLQQKALERALGFSFLQTAQQTLKVYQELCSSTASCSANK